MRVLVTGASGFLGRHVVTAFLDRGHQVRALVRPAAKLAPEPWPEGLQVVRADLRRRDGLAEACAGVDVVVHLAAGTSGTEEAQLIASVAATENLLEAMSAAALRRMVLCSSFSVYDWRRPSRVLDETTPLESRLYERDGYAVAKTWQERVVRQRAGREGWGLTVLRPGYIWGPQLPCVAGAGVRLGRWWIINGPRRRLPLTHVANCAEAFVAAAECDAAVGETFNVVDDQLPTAWRFARDYRRCSGDRPRRVAVPYHLGLTVAHLARLTSRMLFGPAGRLPAVLTPIRYRAMFRSLRFPNTKLTQVTGWRPRLDYAAALAHTHAGAPVPQPVPA